MTVETVVVFFGNFRCTNIFGTAKKKKNHDTLCQKCIPGLNGGFKDIHEVHKTVECPICHFMNQKGAVMYPQCIFN